MLTMSNLYSSLFFFTTPILSSQHLYFNLDYYDPAVPSTIPSHTSHYLYDDDDDDIDNNEDDIFDNNGFHLNESINAATDLSQEQDI